MVTERKEIADSGYPKARAQEAQDVDSSTTTKTEARRREIDDNEHQVR